MKASSLFKKWGQKRRTCHFWEEQKNIKKKVDMFFILLGQILPF